MPATQADVKRLGAWSALLNPDQNIDRRKCHRVVPMEVLNLSPPRTGTLSMNEAFRILGYQDPYHYASLFANSRDADMWSEALDAKFRPETGKKPLRKREFDQLLGHCSAVCDIPCIMFWRELVEAYPDAKVVLIEREEAKWLKSIRVVFEGVLNPAGRYVLRFADPSRTGRILGCGINWIDAWFRLNGNISVERAMANAPATYREHYREIRGVVPADRCLEYRLGSGWEPLCKFLGKDIPSVPFPHLNDAATLEASFGTFLKEAFKASLLNMASVVGAGAVVAGVLWKSLPLIIRGQH